MSIYRFAHHVTAHKTNIDDLKIYPNPSNCKFNIICNLANNEKAAITVYDLMGKVIYRNEKVKGYRFSLNLTGNHEGVYYLKFETDSIYKIKKIILIN